MTDPNDKNGGDAWRFRDALRAHGAVEPSDEAKARMWKSIEAGISEPQRRRAPRLVPALAGAAVVVVAVAAIYYLGQSRVSKPGPGATISQSPAQRPAFVWTHESGGAIAAGSEVAAVDVPKKLRFGARASAVVDIGAALDLRTGEIAAAVTRGAVDFEVEKDPGAPPFAVEARGVRVTVLGTAFRVGVHGDAVSVRVSRGLVAVKTATATHTLKAGDEWSSTEGLTPTPAPKVPGPASVEPAQPPRHPEEKAPEPREKAEPPKERHLQRQAPGQDGKARAIPSHEGKDDGAREEKERHREKVLEKTEERREKTLEKEEQRIEKKGKEALEKGDTEKVEKIKDKLDKVEETQKRIEERERAQEERRGDGVVGEPKKDKDAADDLREDRKDKEGDKEKRHRDRKLRDRKKHVKQKDKKEP